MEVREAIEGSYVFEGLPPGRANELAQLADVHEFLPGEPILRRGEESSHLYVVLEGYVGLEEAPAITFGPGDVIGEVALVDGGPRSATVVALEATVAAKIHAVPVVALMDNDPAVGYRIALNLARTLCARLRKTTNVAADEYDDLLLQSRN